MKRLMILVFIGLTIALSSNHSVHGINAFHEITVENVNQIEEIARASVNEGLSSIAFQSGDQMLAGFEGWGDDARVVIFSTPSLEKLETEMVQQWPYGVTYSPDGSILAVTSAYGLIEIFDAETLELITAIQSDEALLTVTDRMHQVAIDPTNRYVAVGYGHPVQYSYGTYIAQVIDITTGEQIAAIMRGDDLGGVENASAVQFDESGAFVYVTSWEDILYQIDVETGEVVVLVPEIGTSEKSSNGNRIFALANDGRIVYVSNNAIRLLSDNGIQDIALDVEITSLDWWAVSSLEAHPFQPLIVISYVIPFEGWQSTVLQVWDIDKGELKLDMRSPELTLAQAVFSPDGTLLATSGSGGIVRLWGIPANE